MASGKFFGIHQELRREGRSRRFTARFADDASSRARFIREAEITGSLEHPGIVPVYGLGVAGDGRPYYAMRFIQGRSLDESIKEFNHGSKPSSRPAKLQFRELLRRFIDVCNAVSMHTAAASFIGIEAGERHARPVRRNAGGRLGIGEIAD